VSLTKPERVAWLEKVPLLRGCSAETIARLAEVTGELEFVDGQVIVQQGQVGNGLYIVGSGAVRIVAGGNELAQLRTGEFFGELTVIDQQPRNATAYAVGRTTCLALASWDLVALVERDPGLALNLLRELASRLRQADARIRD